MNVQNAKHINGHPSPVSRHGTTEAPETADLEFAIKNLNNAWRAAQTERTRVADFRRKNGELVPGDIDLDAARTSVCEQLDRIAASLKTS